MIPIVTKKIIFGTILTFLPPLVQLSVLSHTHFSHITPCSLLPSDIEASSLRKRSRSPSNLHAAVQIVPTAVYRSLFSHLSVYLVDQIIDLCSYAYARLTTPEKQERAIAAARESLRASAIKRLRLLGNAILSGAVGHFIGTAVSPGAGTYIVGFVFDTLPYALPWWGVL